MNCVQVEKFRTWFYFYVQSFASDDPDIQRNMDLKEQHTRHVCRNALDIGKDLGLDDAGLCLAETTALFHDVGRFEQYKQYKTFSDQKSVNHAAFGMDILKQKAVLAGLPDADQAFIVKVIGYHNQAQLPEDEDDQCLFYSRLLRDADKLDIWRVATDYYGQKQNGQDNDAIELGLPDTPGISPVIYEHLTQGKPILYGSMQNLNDFKLLQVGWVYDINYRPTLARLKARGYLEKLRNALPETEAVRRIFHSVQAHMEERLQECPAGKGCITKGR